MKQTSPQQMTNSRNATVDVEHLLDNAACASQVRELLRTDDGDETVLREAVRMNVVEPLLKLLSQSAVPDTGTGETPRTDAVAASAGYLYDEVVPADLARQLERELAASRGRGSLPVAWRSRMRSGDGWTDWCLHDRAVAYRPGIEVEPLYSQSAIPEWVSTRDRLPEKDGTYWIMVDGDVISEMEKVVFYKGRWIYNDGSDYDCEIAWWRPLPPPPNFAS